MHRRPDEARLGGRSHSQRDGREPGTATIRIANMAAVRNGVEWNLDEN